MSEAAVEFPAEGRLLGIDHGERRVGLAVCDAGRMMASPLETLERVGMKKDFPKLQAIILRERAVGLVVGLPTKFDGSESPQSAKVREWAALLAAAVSLPVVFAEERYSTVFAEQELWDAGLTHKQRKARRDAQAARHILQSYLDLARVERGDAR